MIHQIFNRCLEMPRRVAFILYFGEHDGKMIRAYSRHQVGIPYVSRQPLGHLPQQRVAGGLAEAVVDVLEPFQIDQEQCKLMTVADSAAHVLRNTLEKEAAI